MLVRAVQHVPLVRAVALTALTIAIPQQRYVGAQETVRTPATHTVKRGDTLWDIARLYLADPFLWPEVYRLNTDVIENPHWIYPGEVLKLPATVKVVAGNPPAETRTSAPRGDSLVAVPTPPLAPVQASGQEPGVGASSIRVGEYAASPWVDERGGPRGSGYIIQTGDLPGIATATHPRLQLHDRIFIAPPVGSVAPERELFLAYKLGPLIEDFGQIVIPTGIVEVTRPPRNGEAATARVLRMFAAMDTGQRLIPYDSSAAIVAGRPSAVSDEASSKGRVRWIYNEPVLPSLQSYIVVDMSGRQGLTTGDQIELYQPRTPPTEGQSLALPEISIARAQVLRVTQFGTTAIIYAQEQPRIQPGTAARVAAKMP